MDPGFKLKQIGVTMLGVKDAQRSTAIYRDKLGRAVKSAFEGFVFLDGGGVTQCLSEALAKNSPSLVGATEVVFSVATYPRLMMPCASLASSSAMRREWSPVPCGPPISATPTGTVFRSSVPSTLTLSW